MKLKSTGVVLARAISVGAFWSSPTSIAVSTQSFTTSPVRLSLRQRQGRWQNALFREIQHL